MRKRGEKGEEARKRRKLKGEGEGIYTREKWIEYSKPPTHSFPSPILHRHPTHRESSLGLESVQHSVLVRRGLGCQGSDRGCGAKESSRW